MSVIRLFFKTNGQKNTARVRIGKYTISSHAQNRIVDPKRQLSKLDLLINLYGDSENSNPYVHKDGKTIQYDRINRHNRTITHIVKKNHTVKSIRKYHKKRKK